MLNHACNANSFNMVLSFVFWIYGNKNYDQNESFFFFGQVKWNEIINKNMTDILAYISVELSLMVVIREGPR
jgi:hypothetical protein